MGVMFHAGEVKSYQCHNDWKDKIFPMSWWLWRNRKVKLSGLCDIAMTDEQFQQWLVKIDADGLMNGWKVLEQVWAVRHSI